MMKNNRRLSIACLGALSLSFGLAGCSSPDGGSACTAVSASPFDGVLNADPVVIKSATGRIYAATHDQEVVIPYIDTVSKNLRARAWDGSGWKDILALSSFASDSLAVDDVIAFYTTRWNFVVAGNAPQLNLHEAWTTVQKTPGGDVGAGMHMTDYDTSATITLSDVAVNTDQSVGLLAGFTPATFQDRATDQVTWGARETVTWLGMCTLFDPTDHSAWVVGLGPISGHTQVGLFHRQGNSWSTVGLGLTNVSGIQSCALVSGGRVVLAWDEADVNQNTIAHAGVVDLAQQKLISNMTLAYPQGTIPFNTTLTMKMAVSPDQKHAVLLYFDATGGRLWKSEFDGTTFGNLSSVLGGFVVTRAPAPFYDACTGKAMVYAGSRATQQAPETFGISSL